MVALSILLDLPDAPVRTTNWPWTHVDVSPMQVPFANVPGTTIMEKANERISPYFKLANTALKETFASPSVDALSSMLVLANCHQVQLVNIFECVMNSCCAQLMSDPQTAYLYTTYATGVRIPITLGV